MIKVNDHWSSTEMIYDYSPTLLDFSGLSCHYKFIAAQMPHDSGWDTVYWQKNNLTQVQSNLRDHGAEVHFSDDFSFILKGMF